MATTLTTPDSPKAIRETLCVAQIALGYHPLHPDRPQHMALLSRLIAECDRHRPLGPDGKHGTDRCTATCGCDAQSVAAPARIDAHGRTAPDPTVDTPTEVSGGPEATETAAPDCAWWVCETPEQHRASCPLGGQCPSRDETRPRIVALCGSTRFRDEFAAANAALTRQGYIVLAPGVFGHAGDPLTDEEKTRLDELHMRKIDIAHEVYVVAPGGYIGESTRREIAYAEQLGRPVRVDTSPRGGGRQ